MEPILSVNNLHVSFQSEHQLTEAVKDISFSVSRGEILAIVGESGSGKSVTSLSMLQLLPASTRFSGSIKLFPGTSQETELVNADSGLMQKIRGNEIAMIFQEPMTSLNPVMRCGKQVVEALLAHRKISAGEAKRETLGWFQKVQLPDPAGTFNKYPHQLSGGQKQRVMIAMAMVCNPKLLICDEPTTALDVTVQRNILDLIRQLQVETDMGVIFITHDLGVVAEIADRVAVMYKGEIVQIDKVENIFSANNSDNKPPHPYTKALIACRPANHLKGIKLPVVSDFLKNGVTTISTTIAEVPKSKILYNKSIVQVKDLTVQYPSSNNLFGKSKSFLTAADKVNFEIFEGETLGLVGESGCGKTTLGRALLGLTPISAGEILYNGISLKSISSSQLKKFRKDVQLIFQDPYSSLNPRLSNGEAIAEPMRLSSRNTGSRERREKTRELLDRVGLAESSMRKYPHEFSGGQRQRIVIARALAVNPEFLVCDESVSALDVSVQAQVLNLLNELKHDLKLTMLFISHDLSVVRYMCDRIMVMQKGRIVESGTADDLYLNPKTNYTKTLLSAIPRL